MSSRKSIRLRVLTTCLLGLAGCEIALAQQEDPSGFTFSLENFLQKIESLDTTPQEITELLGNPAASMVWTLDSPEVQHFESKIRPVLLETCLTCHGGDETRANLRLDSREALLKGGDRGPAIDIANPSQSLLLQAIRYNHDELRMPPKEKLPDETIQEFEQWVESGVAWPSESASPKSMAQAGSPHWAFQPISPVVPLQDSTDGSQSEIDRFVRSQLGEKGLKPSNPADKRTLARRLYYDLIGLPPTPRELEDYLSDTSPESYSNLVERLLASPHYGERWGRHWMDVIRYADTAGDAADYPVPELRRYRDYIIDSFNSDKPYDLFIKEQIAGDLLVDGVSEEVDAERIIATGFIALSRRFGTGPYQTMHEVIEDTIETMGRAFMGMTFKCARCHDHKFDPITTEDYYGLYGIFSSTQYPFAGSETSVSQGDVRQHFVPLSRDPKARQAIEEYNREIEESRAVLKYLEEEDPLKAEIKKYEDQVASLEVAIRLSEERDDLEGEPLKDLLLQASKNRDEKSEELRKKITEKKNRLREIGFRGSPSDVAVAYAVSDRETPIDERIQIKGEPGNPGDVVPRNVPAVLRHSGPIQAPTVSSGRLQLAQWLADAKHPLTARVMANRIWQYHFGKGIVGSPSNFGVMGEKPTHPQLLDWLAAEFVRSGWSIKAMHRLIVHSQTYGMSSEFDSTNAEIDPQNDFLWRYPPRRLDAESIRDSMLAASGLLDRGRAGDHPFPPMNDWRYTQHDPFQSIYPSFHRSVYLMTPRFQRHPYLGLFDGPDTNRSTDVRSESTVPLQSLFFMNNDFVEESSIGLAERLLISDSSDADRIRLAYWTVLCRNPSEEESQLASDYISEYREELIKEKGEMTRAETLAWASFGKVLFSSNEFLYLD